MTSSADECPFEHGDRQNLLTSAPSAPLPPGPRGIPGLGAIPFLARDLYGYLPSLARTYGDVVRVPIPGMTVISISHPDHVKHVMTQHVDVYPKADQIKGIFGDDPPTHAMLEGDEWKRVRKLLNPMFNNTSLTLVQDLVADGVTDTFEQWDTYACEGIEVDLQREFQLLTMTVFLRAKFDFQASRSLVADLVTWYHEYGSAQTWNALMWSAPQWVPRPRARAGQSAHWRIMEFIERLIALRRADPVDAHDLLTVLLEARFADGTAMSDPMLRNELHTLIFGGFETTAAALAWTIAQLDKHPDAAAQALAEVDALGGKYIRLDDHKQLTWIKACFDEAQRLQGIPMIPRRTAHEDEIGGYRIPKGSTLVIAAAGIQRDPRFWRDPDTYDPARFLNDKVNPYAFLPFGVGPRRCTGMQMAYMVATQTLGTALQRYRFELPANFEPKKKFTLSTNIAGGLPVIIHRRGNAARPPDAGCRVGRRSRTRSPAREAPRTGR